MDDLEQLLESTRDAIGEVTRSLSEGEITWDRWITEMSELLALAALTASMLGFDGTELPQLLIEAVESEVAAQYSYLDNFGVEIAASKEGFLEGWKSRAASYANFIKVPYWKGRTKMLPLPAMPAQGTQCLGNCKCTWRVEKASGGYNCYWQRDADDSCQTCVQREREWSPLFIAQTSDGPELTFKHLAGQHNQQSHAGKGGGKDLEQQLVGARRAVYNRMRDARASGDYSGISQLRTRVRSLERKLGAAANAAAVAGQAEADAATPRPTASSETRVAQEAAEQAKVDRLNDKYDNTPAPEDDWDGDPLSDVPESDEYGSEKVDTTKYDPAGVFKHRQVTVDIKDEDLRNISKELGKKVTAQDIADLVGAPDDAIIQVSWMDDEGGYGVETDHEYFSDTQRRLIKTKYGGNTISNESFGLKDSAPKGLGTSVLNRQVNTAKRLGFKKIVTYAVRAEGKYNGYYTWPRLGYDTEVPSYTKPRAVHSPHPSVRNARRVSDYMKTPEGRAFWKEHGDGAAMEFDLADGSLSNYVLTTYVTEKMNG